MNTSGATSTHNAQEGTMAQTATPVTTTLVLDHRGLLATTDGLVHYLTPCCRASVKGSANSPTGACCRTCYYPVESALGAGWNVTDTASWDAWEGAYVDAMVRLNPANADSPVLAQLITAVREQAAAAA